VKIVIIDDEKDICFILGIELQNLGHKTVSFSSMKEAMNYFETDTCDAILCDFQMPMMSGLDLFQWLQNKSKNIPFYILTGEPAMDTQQILESGVKDILFKPQDLLRLSQIFK
jgi:DNA-binding NtrC family response regulator